MDEQEFYVVDFQPCDGCGKEFNGGLAVRLNDEAVPRPGKYVTMMCIHCGTVQEFKRSGWWNLSLLDETILDDDGKDKLIRNLPDYTHLLR